MVLLFVLMAIGCGTFEKAGRKQSLHAVLKTYEHTVRWGSVATLPQFLQKDLLDSQQSVAVDPDNVRVINYEVISPPIMRGENTVEQTARIEFLFKDRQVVHPLIDRQQWEYDEAAKNWFRSNLIPLFR